MGKGKFIWIQYMRTQSYLQSDDQHTNMTFKKKYTIAHGFEKMFEMKDGREEHLHDAKIIQMKILIALEDSFTTPISKKELAVKLNTSPSYITQLYRGDKLMNLEMLSRIQVAFGLEFDFILKKLIKKRKPSQLLPSSRRIVPMKYPAKKIQHA